MKKFLPLLCVFLLTSCLIGVDDFGKYWDQGTVDKNLLGKWEPYDPQDTAPKNQKAKSNSKDDGYLILENKGTYKICGHSQDLSVKFPMCDMVGRTLKVGPYSYIMLKGFKEEDRRHNILLKYRLDNDILTLDFPPDTDAIGDLIKTAHPELSDLLTGDTPRVSFPQDGTIKITTLDDEVLRLLSAIPQFCDINKKDDATCWRGDTKFSFKKGMPSEEEKQFILLGGLTPKQQYIVDMITASETVMKILQNCNNLKNQTYVDSYYCSHDKIMTEYGNAHYIFMNILEKVETKRLEVFKQAVGNRKHGDDKKLYKAFYTSVSPIKSEIAKITNENITSINPNLTDCQVTFRREDFDYEASRDDCKIWDPIKYLLMDAN